MARASDAAEQHARAPASGTRPDEPPEEAASGGDLAVGDATSAAAAILRPSSSVWIGTHVDPDGDAVGSALGLAHLLWSVGKEVTVSCADPVPFEVSSLPGTERVTDTGPSDEQVLIAVDTADSLRLGRLFDAAIWRTRPSIVIDHHVSNRGFGTVDMIDPSRASAAEMVLDLAGPLGTTPSIEAATCLLMGIVTDTLGFRTPNTTERTLASARRLMQLGASLPSVTQQAFYAKPMSALRLYGLALERLTLRGPFAFTWIERADLAATAADPEAMRGITSLVATAAEPLAVAVLRERQDGWVDVSLRSKPGIDVLPAAVALGGGGHPQAAGTKVAGPLDQAVELVMETLDRRTVVENAADGDAG